MHPRAKIDGIDVTDTTEGFVVHDRNLQQRHTLHPLTALVWKHADGSTSVAHLAEIARQELGNDVTEELVWSALDSLAQAKLLDERLAPPSGAQRFGRRDLIRRVATGGAAAAALGAMAVSTASAQNPKEKDPKDGGSKEEASKNKEQSSKEGGSKTPGENPLDLVAGWENFGFDFQGASWSRHGRLVALEGLVVPTFFDEYDRSNRVPFALIAVLPEGSRPSARLVFSVRASVLEDEGSPISGSGGGSSSGSGSTSSSSSSSGLPSTQTGDCSLDSARIDILADGQILLVDGNVEWLSLSGIVFSSARVATGGGGEGEQDRKAANGEQRDKNVEEREKKQDEREQKGAQEDAEKARAREEKEKANAQEDAEKAQAKEEKQKAADKKDKDAKAGEQKKKSA